MGGEAGEMINKAMENDQHINPKEVADIAKGLKDKTESKDFEEAMKNGSEKVGQGIINFFNGENAMNILNTDDQSKESYKNVIDFMMNYLSHDLSSKTYMDLKTIRKDIDVTNPSALDRLKKQTKNNNQLVDKILLYTKTNDNDRVEKTFSIELREKRKGELMKELDNKDTEIYKNITDTLIGQMFKKEINDGGLMKEISTLIPNEKQNEQIKEYISGITSPSTIKLLYDKNYSSIRLPSSSEGSLRDMVKSINEKALAYKKNQININMKTTVDSELSKYPFNQELKIEIQENLYGQIDKITKKYNENEITTNYRIRENEKAAFKGEIRSVLNEKAAEENRTYLLSQFDAIKSVTFQNKKETNTIQIDEKEKAHFESMIDETRDEYINTLALAVGKDSSILQDLRVKVKEKGDDKNSVAFSNVNITYATKPEDIQKIEESLDTRSTYTKQLEATNTSNVIETSKASMVAKIQQYMNNSSKEMLEIQVPNDDVVYNQMSTIITDTLEGKDLGASGKAIALNKVSNINTVKIISKEINEVSGTIKLDLHDLEANMIGDPSKINEVLSQSDAKMKTLLEDQNYKITGGSIYGSASKNFSGYKNETPFLLGSNVKKENPVNEPQNRDISNNPELAYNRAASFIDYFLDLEGKTVKTASFDMTYGVNGPTRMELTEQLKKQNEKTPTEEAILEAFKQRQYANIQLDFIKTEVKSEPTEYVLDTKSVASGFSVNIIGTQPKIKHPPRSRFSRFGSSLSGPQGRGRGTGRGPIPCSPF